MKERDEAREARDRDRQDETKQQLFKEKRNNVKRIHFQACSAYYASSYKNSRAKTWTDIRRFLLASKKPEPQIGTPADRDPDWTRRLNTHFVTMGADVAAELSAANQRETLLPRPPRVVSDAFRVRPVTLPKLSRALWSCKNSSACSSDGITVEMLKCTFAVVGPHLKPIL